MSNSPLISYTKISPNKTAPRNHVIDRITPHIFVGQVSVERIGKEFEPVSRKASCNYGVSYDGRVALIVDEKDRSWCSSSADNDNRAITIEIASDNTAPYALTDKAYNAFIDLCVDICERYGKTKLIWNPNQLQALAYEPKDDEMLLTVHRWFWATACPGDWLFGRLGEVAAEVTRRLNPEAKTLYRVQVGAYHVKQNAEHCLERAKAAGFTDAFITVAEV